MISRFCKSLSVVVCVLGIFASSLLYASDDLYDAPGVDTRRENLSSIPEEHIDLFTGGLTLSHVDFTLPGNGGLDLVIQRTFNSKNVCNGWTCVGSSCSCSKGENTWLGYGWSLHFGRLFKSYNVNNKHFVEMPDGSMHAAYTKSGSTTFITKDYWLLDLGSSYVLTLTNGTKIYYEQNGPPNPKYPQHSIYYATKIQDVNGNEINIHYKTAGSNIISYVIDSDGRRIDFTTGTVNGAVRLTSISGPGVSVSYTHQPLTALFDTILTKANLPVGNPWVYAYDSLELKSVKTPYGGEITYSYSFSEVIMGGSYLQYRTVSQKSVGGRDIPAGTWSILYSQGSNNEYTQISDPCGRTFKYSFFGYGSTYLPDGNMWEIGLPKSREIVGEETIAYEWTKSSSISNDDYILPTGHRDYYIYVPLLTKKSVTRGGETYTTGYSSHDSYGNPKTVSESGDKTRTTTKTYWYNAAKNIIHNKPLSETVSGGFSGTFTTNYSYDGNGNLTQGKKYGVVTSYSYYNNGNLYSTTDANGKTSSYQWSNGRISKITNPIYSILRSINSNGTIASETNGRGFTTNYTFDGNLRLTSITPPAGNKTNYSYPADNAYKMESRGEANIYYYYDGFGRTSGTYDSKGVDTDVIYKSCGLKNYIWSNIGDTAYYDNFGRIKESVHKDSTKITYSYSGSNMSVTDEDAKTTLLTYNAFGSPDEKLLISIKDALNNTASYNYNILGSVTSITQGNLSRTFSYSSKNFLSSETHPEKGTIIYGRDNVGNMTSRKDSLGTTTYNYDGLNRLKNVNYGTGSVSLTYDDANNRKSMDNPSTSIDYTYDAANRLTKKEENISGRYYTTTYTYDGNDNIISISYPSDRHVVYTYDSNNQVTSVKGFGDSITGITYYTSGTSIGLPKSFAYSSGPTISLTYSNRNLTTQIKAGTSILDMRYDYDNRGNTTLISDYLNNFGDQTFSYDDINRLSSFNGLWGTGAYIYNAVGNRLRNTVAGTITDYNYSNNRLTSTTGGEVFSFGYNTNGDLTTMNGYTLEYDRLHNLLKYKQGSTILAEFGYDGDGMRITKMSNGDTVVSHYDKEGRVISENDDNGILIADYIYLNGKLAAKIINDESSAPAAPTDLNASAISSSQISLTWTDNSADEAGFKIERKNGAGGTYSQIAIVGTNVTTYSDTGLTSGTAYYYRVRAYNSDGDSAYSNEADAITYGCTYSISPTSRLHGSGAETGSVTVTAASGCIWAIINNAPSWMTVTSGSIGSGNGTVTYSITANSSTSSRIGTLTIAGQTFTVIQAFSGCANLPVRITGATTAYYSSLQAAYNAAMSGDIIQSRAITFTENISVNRNISITMQGGFDCYYATNNGNISLLKGMIQTFTGGGTLTIGNFTLVQQ